MFKNNQHTGKTTDELFWEKVNKSNESECWEWIAAKDSDGYGLFYPKTNPNGIGAHRFSWILHNGSIPKGMGVLHKCDNRKCVNPNHLFLGTQQVNVWDMMEKGRQAIRVGAKNGRTILSENDVREIRSMRLEGMTYKEIAKAKDVSEGCVNHVLNERHWGWLK